MKRFWLACTCVAVGVIGLLFSTTAAAGEPTSSGKPAKIQQTVCVLSQDMQRAYLIQDEALRLEAIAKYIDRKDVCVRTLRPNIVFGFVDKRWVLFSSAQTGDLEGIIGYVEIARTGERLFVMIRAVTDSPYSNKLVSRD